VISLSAIAIGVATGVATTVAVGIGVLVGVGVIVGVGVGVGVSVGVGCLGRKKNPPPPPPVDVADTTLAEALVLAEVYPLFPAFTVMLYDPTAENTWFTAYEPFPSVVPLSLPPSPQTTFTVTPDIGFPSRSVKVLLDVTRVPTVGVDGADELKLRTWLLGTAKVSPAGVAPTPKVTEYDPTAPVYPLPDIPLSGPTTNITVSPSSAPSFALVSRLSAGMLNPK
jgi:hypothetical protein